MAGHRRWGVVSAAVLSSLTACHRAPAHAEVAAPLCAPAAEVEARTSGRLRIDGPGAWGPSFGDSVVLVVDGVERWRGTYEACRDGRAASPLLRTADSVVSVMVVRGDSARGRYRIGGARPSAVLVETRRTP